MQPFDRHWTDGNFRVIRIMISVVLSEAVCFPVGPPIGSNTFHRPGGGEVIGEIVWHIVIVGMIGVDNMCVSDIKGFCGSQVVSTASMNDKVSTGWVFWGRCFSGNLFKREVLQNHWTFDSLD